MTVTSPGGRPDDTQRQTCGVAGMEGLLIMMAVGLAAALDVAGVQEPSVLEDATRLDLQIFNCELQIKEPCATNTRIVFLLFTGMDQDPVELNGSYVELPEDYDSSRPLKVLIHGFAGGTPRADRTTEIIAAYLKAGGYNVLYVDWYRLANLPCYVSSALNTLQVGRCVAEMLARLSHIHPPHSVHLLGFSLGAHAAAFTSNYLEDMTGYPVGRITGLDPALPLFATINAYKLDKTDAYFVDVIHCGSGTYGKIEPTGDIDFYVNGQIQPNCVDHRNPKLCSHMLTNTYFAESIGSLRGFWGSPCSSWYQYAFGLCTVITPNSPMAEERVIMGEHTPSGVSGIYIVVTADEPPFAVG